MTIDEAITHCEEIANSKCNNCGAEHKQLAEWLKDYKRLLEQEPKKGHWIDIHEHHYYNDGDIETTELRCSCCNETVEWDIELLHKPYYCENCGSKNE